MSAPLPTFAYANPAFDPYLASAWAISQQEVTGAMRFANQYRRVIEERDDMLDCHGVQVHVHSAAYVERCEKLLPWALSLYLEHVKRISETEHEMALRGMAFAKSSDAWEQ